MSKTAVNISSIDLAKHPMITVYRQVIKGERKVFPRGTWQNDENIVVIIRYVMEVKLSLSKQEIPNISRELIHEHKLWGALNRFKSVRKLLQFVYPDEYNVFDFPRMPRNYWENLGNTKKRFEECLERSGLVEEDIPNVVMCDRLVQWGLIQPLKLLGYSPFRFIDTLYSGRFREIDFKTVPQGYGKNTRFLRELFLAMLEKEQIAFHEVPEKVTQQMLIKHRFSSALKYHKGSPSELILNLFPDKFDINDFHTKNGHWKNVDNVKAEINKLIEEHRIERHEIPKRFIKAFFMENNLYGLIQEYNASPIQLVNTIFPGEFDITEFQRVPNQYWFTKEHRTEALRTYCKKRSILREDIPALNRAYFRKHFPRFISMVDRHYESKFYLWIMDSFPEFDFKPEDFNLLIGQDGQVCDSKEELAIHNYLLHVIDRRSVQRESERIYNHNENEVYIPDWIIRQNDRIFLIEYFGLYGSTKYPGYDEKTERKVTFFRDLDNYVFIAIYPDDFHEEGFGRINSLLEKSGVELKNSG
ncbi:DUF4046 domain-containing protein [Bacillus marinisedimentorum]|uniref:DUF4046 domain-containing protein n=1 Tax=Bacillus marinisedimentorum TaxID=1821260 RepID=UPI0007E23685|nr:DUF4046 domain-containing protein [Bacillus marinisedimentorum]